MLKTIRLYNEAHPYVVAINCTLMSVAFNVPQAQKQLLLLQLQPRTAKTSMISVLTMIPLLPNEGEVLLLPKARPRRLLLAAPSAKHLHYQTVSPLEGGELDPF